MSDSEHAPLAPSSAHRWMNCPGSRHMSVLYPEDPEGEAARQGTAAHWAMQESLTGNVIAEGQIAPNGWVLDAEMVEGAELYAEEVRKAKVPYMVEKPITMFKRIHEKCWGTPDTRGDPRAFDGKVLRLWDYKYGHGVVEAFENPQLACYAAGMAEELNLDGLDETRVMIDMRIVQPRVYHREGFVRRWYTSLAYLRGFWNRMHAAANESFTHKPTLHTGAHCLHCPASHACPALQNAVGHIADRALVSVPLDLPVNALGFERKLVTEMMTRLQARADGLDQQIDKLLRAGHLVPFYRMETQLAREQWKVTDEAVIELGLAFGKNLAKPAKALTPRQARLAGIDEATVAAISERPRGGIKVVPDDGSFARARFVVDTTVNNG